MLGQTGKKVKTSTVTPERAAAQFAASHADFSGVVMVTSCSPAGKGGWKLTSKNKRFVVTGGRSVLRMEKRENDWRNTRWNGICPVCDGLRADRLIQWWKAPDGLSVRACTECAVAHGLVAIARDEYLSFPYSRLETFDIDRVDALLDIRSVQMGLDDAKVSTVILSKEQVLARQQAAMAERAHWRGLIRR